MANTSYETQLRNDAIARTLASGLPPEKVCLLYDLTPTGLRALERQDDFRERVSFYQERFRVALEEQARYADLLLGKSLRALDDDLDDPTSKTRIDTAKTIAAPFLKSLHTTTTQTNNHLHLDQNALVTLGSALQKLAETKTIQPSYTPLDSDPNLHDPQ